MTEMLKGKVAIVTGGGRGLGRTFALRFAAEGAKLFLPDISLERAESVAQEIQTRGGEAQAMQVDILSESDTQKMAEKVIQRFGRVDILVNNAAVWFGLNAKPWDSWDNEE